jgi:hypothetical protein
MDARQESEEAHLRRLIHQINISALCARASLLRNGVDCFASLPQEHESLKGLQFGGFNLHVDLKFDDGIVWVARFRLLKVNRPSVAKVNFDRLSEVSVYRLLRQTTIPVPAVYDFALDGSEDNPVGAGYILLQKLAGRPMNWTEASTEQKNYIFRQLRDIYLEIEKIPQISIGRPTISDNQAHDIHVGPSFFEYDANRRSIPRGPFPTSFEWYKASINHRRDLILGGEIAVRDRSDALLVNSYLFNCIHRVVDPIYSSNTFLKHVDSRDCNFLIDHEYTITGIIDWELAFFAPKDSAFQSPLFMVDVRALYSGRPSISLDEEKFAREFEMVGRTDIANLIRNATKSRCFEFSIYTDPYKRDDFESLFAGAWRAIEGEEKEFSWTNWKDRIQKEEMILENE